MDQESETPVLEADPTLILGKIDTWIDGFFRLLPNIAVALVVLLVMIGIGLLAKWAIRRATRKRDRSDLGAVAGSVMKWVIWGLGTLFALTIVMPSLKPGNLVAGLGLGSVAIGFAFRDLLQNLLAGILLLIRQPFRPGDQITVDGHEGTVEHIDSRATLIRTYDARRVVIPNSDVYTSAVVVQTAFPARRSEYDFGISYGSDTARALEVAVAAARTVSGVADDPAPDALSLDLGDFAKTVRLRWWTTSQHGERLQIRSDVMLAVEAAFAENGIEIPFPTRTLLIEKPEG